MHEWIKMKKARVGLDLKKMHRHCSRIYHFPIKLCGNDVSWVPYVCGEMGLYQYKIISKPCLIYENMTQVSGLIYLKEQAVVSDESVAKDEGALGWK